MKYTIQFNIDIDCDEILSEKEVKDYIEDTLDSTSITVSDFQLLDVND